MGQREQVTASLLAGHGVDDVARRRVAEKVHQVTAEALQGFCLPEGIPGDVVPTAAAAVVLASDLRAPAGLDHVDLFGGKVTTPAEDFAAGMAAAEADDAARTCPTCGYHCSTADHAGVQAEIDAARASAGEHMRREGWRPRLANVERLLSESRDAHGRWASDQFVDEALAEVRSMIDGK